MLHVNFIKVKGSIITVFIHCQQEIHRNLHGITLFLTLE